MCPDQGTSTSVGDGCVPPTPPGVFTNIDLLIAGGCHHLLSSAPRGRQGVKLGNPHAPYWARARPPNFTYANTYEDVHIISTSNSPLKAGGIPTTSSARNRSVVNGVYTTQPPRTSSPCTTIVTQNFSHKSTSNSAVASDVPTQVILSTLQQEGRPIIATQEGRSIISVLHSKQHRAPLSQMPSGHLSMSRVYKVPSLESCCEPANVPCFSNRDGLLQGITPYGCLVSAIIEASLGGLKSSQRLLTRS